jgi:hypothetical protein
MPNATTTRPKQFLPRSWLAWVGAVALLLAGIGTVHADVPGTAAASLRAKYATLRGQLDHNPFQAPLYLSSQQTADRLEGDLYGIIDHSFAAVGASLTGANQWCDILMLHLNVKDCRVSTSGTQSSLAVYVGGKRIALRAKRATMSRSSCAQTAVRLGPGIRGFWWRQSPWNAIGHLSISRTRTGTASWQDSR